METLVCGSNIFTLYIADDQVLLAEGEEFMKQD